MRLRPLAPFGLEIDDFQCADADDVEDLARLIAKSRFAVLRGQSADDAAFVRFLARFGELTFTEGETPVPGAPALNIVSNVGREQPPRSVFHTDTSYVARPPAFSALRAVELPSNGGDTLFSDQVAAARRLPRRARAMLADRSVLHGLTDGPVGAMARHPLFRHHPLTNEVSLFLSTPARCGALSRVDQATSARVIAALYWHSTRASRLARHSWRPGDVVIWDNRVTMHRADHRDVRGNRVLHRGMVLGEVPVPAKSLLGLIWRAKRSGHLPFMKI